MTPAPVFDRSSPCAGAGPAVQPVRVADDAQLVRATRAAVADGRRHRHAVEPAGHRHRAAQRECPSPAPSSRPSPPATAPATPRLAAAAAGANLGATSQHQPAPHAVTSDWARTRDEAFLSSWLVRARGPPGVDANTCRGALPARRRVRALQAAPSHARGSRARPRHGGRAAEATRRAVAALALKWVDGRPISS